MDKKTKHLEFIQSTIGRLAQNSFLLKGWAVTIVAAVFALSAKDETLKRILAVYCLIGIFWFLDSYFLLQERMFRALYDNVRKLKEDQIDFSMNTKMFSKLQNCSRTDIFFSHTLLIFYVPLMLITIAVFLLK